MKPQKSEQWRKWMRKTGKQEMLVYFVEVFFSLLQATTQQIEWFTDTESKEIEWKRKGESADADIMVAIDMENISFSKMRVGGTTHDNIKVNISRMK